MQFTRFFLTIFILTLLYLSVATKIVNASSDLIGTWMITSSLPFQNASFATLTNDEIFIMGGATSDDFSTVYKSESGSSGQINSWTAQLNLPNTRYWMNSAFQDNYVFLLGGASFNGSTAFSNEVIKGNVLSGSIQSWSQLNPLPQSLAHGGTFIVNDRLYFVGGLGSIFSDDIYSAEINPDGTIGSWISSGTLPNPTFNMAIFEKDGIIYMLGGAINGVGTKKIYTANLSEIDGSISGWQPLPDAPNFPMGQQTILMDDTIIFVAENKTYHARIIAPGVLDSWHVDTHQLPYSIGAGRLIEKNGYLYLIGGHNGAGYLDTVYFTKLINNEEQEDSILNVNLLKQTDPLWSEEIYDSADKWASTNPGIGKWGCAMTSAAMVFNYHEITKLPDGSVLDPKNLNNWLKDQPDGYVSNGLINWIALSRLSKTAKFQNPNFDHDALEYKRINSADVDQLKTDIDNGIPAILGQPGHFIVGKGYSDSSIYINDPAYNRTDLSEYDNTFLSMGRYIPSNTDLSYILVTGSQALDFELLDLTDQSVGDSYIQDPIQDPTGENQNSSEALRMVYLEQPENGDYIIKIQSQEPKEYDINIYLYEEDGDVVVKNIQGVVGINTNNTVVINFDKEQLEEENITEEISFASLVSDIENYYLLGKIYSFQTKNLLIKHVQLSGKFYEGKSKGVNGQLQALKSIITSQTPFKIAQDASSILMHKIHALQSTL